MKTIQLIREKRQERSTEFRKKYLVKRALMELVDLMVAKKPTDNELKGRSSGSLSWRLQRGEQDKANNVRIAMKIQLKRQLMIFYFMISLF